jgi:hypothetical protein
MNFRNFKTKKKMLNNLETKKIPEQQSQNTSAVGSVVKRAARGRLGCGENETRGILCISKIYIFPPIKIWFQKTFWDGCS